MTWAILVLDLAVVFGPLVAVPYENGNTCSRGLAFEHAREDFRNVCFLPLGGDLGLTRSTAIQIGLKVFLAQVQSSRNTIDNAHVRGAMALAGRTHPKGLSETVTCHGVVILPSLASKRERPQVTIFEF